MANFAIRAVGLSKEYRVGLLESGYGSLRSRLRALRRGPGALDERSFWALRDVSFEVMEGEAMAIIGRNGAGKSTLLKILSRITEPTTGYVDVRGRAGSLLEVGTGFHPELTGRDNVFLNGGILGMRRYEIARKFDAIVDFAGVSKFIDTPVKRYSSGMYVRLAFAVAAFLEPEILIVDEVLAVGDADFQKRCLGKMDAVTHEGRTVIFVSHNMSAVRALCQRTILIEDGHITLDGQSDDVIREYLGRQSRLGEQQWLGDARPGDESCRLEAVRIETIAGSPAPAVSSGQPFRVVLEVDLGAVPDGLCVGFDLLAPDGALVWRTFHIDGADAAQPTLRPGRNLVMCEVPAGLLNEGRYGIAPKIASEITRWVVDGDAAVQFDVIFDHGGPGYVNRGKRPGAIAPAFEWRATPVGEREASASDRVSA